MVAHPVLSARLRTRLHIAVAIAVDFLFCSLVIAVLVQLGLLAAALPASLDNALGGGPLTRASATASKQLRRQGSRQDPSFDCDTVYSPPSSSFFDDITSSSCDYRSLVKPATHAHFDTIITAPHRPSLTVPASQACPPSHASSTQSATRCSTTTIETPSPHQHQMQTFLQQPQDPLECLC